MNLKRNYRVLFLVLLLFLAASQTKTFAQQNASTQNDISKSLAVANALMISKRSQSAIVITNGLIKQLEREGLYDTPLGLKVRLVHGSALVYADTVRTGLDFLLKLKETSRAKKQWVVFAESCRVIAAELEYVEQKEGSLSNLREAQSVISQYHLDSIYPNFAVRISSWHRIFGNRDSSIFYAQEAIRTAIQFGKFFEEAEGHLLLGMNISSTDPQGKISHYIEAAQLYRKAKEFTSFCSMHLGIANLKLASGKPRDAMANIDTAFLYFPLTTENNIERLHRAYILKGNTFQQLGQMDSAIFYLKIGHKKELESLRSLNLDKIVEIDNKYNVTQKVQELDVKNLEIQAGNDRRDLLVVLISMIFVFAGILAFFYLRLRKANQITRDQSKQLKSLDAAKSRFFANVSHELRTPLALMLGPIGTLLKENQLTDKQTNLLQLAQHSSKQLEQLVTDILDLGKLEMGKMELDEKPTELAPFFRSYFAQFESLAKSRQIDFSFEMAVENDVVAHVDQAKCRQLLNNLLSNAFKFTPAGERVEANLSLNDGRLQLIVADTGPGIHPDDLPHLFDRYFQTTRPDKPAEGGTGIGLALCHEYAQLFSGKIEVESTLGQGTTFKVMFPVILIDNAKTPVVAPETHYAARQLQPAAAAEPAMPSDTAKPTILVVEDNPDLQAYIRLILSEKYNVVTTENGQAALERLMGGATPVVRATTGAGATARVAPTVSLILSDLMMPVMDGLQLLEKLKSNDATRQIPVIMLTARADVRDKLKALRIGVDDYLLKPFEEEELLARIENLLRNQLTRKQEAQSEPATETTRLQVSQEDQQWLEGFETYVQKHLSSDILSVSALSSTFAMSESTLLRQLKRLTGLSPLQYLQEVRLQEARRLLENRRYSSIAQVASKVGYNDAHSFTRKFQAALREIAFGYLGRVIFALSRRIPLNFNALIHILTENAPKLTDFAPWGTHTFVPVLAADVISILWQDKEETENPEKSKQLQFITFKMRLKLIMLLLALSSLSINIIQGQDGKLPITSGTTLVVGKKYISESGQHFLRFGTDGNLVIGGKDDSFYWGSFQYGVPLGGNKAVFQADGNLVINKNSDVVWASNSKDGKKMTLDGKGQLIIADANNNTLWKANPGSAVSLFCDPNFGGSYLQLDADGPDRGSFGAIQAGFINFDNLTSSIRVAKGYKVELYVEKVFQNPANKLVLFEGDYKLLGKWNDQISAVKVYPVPEGTPVVKFYDGWWNGLQQNLGPGKYDSNNLIDDNIFTTMDVPGGSSIMVYPNSGFSGVGNSEPIKKKQSTTAAYEAVDLKNTYYLNDMISSIEIARPYYVLDKTVITNTRILDGGTNEIVGIKMTGTNNAPTPSTVEPTLKQTYRDENRIAWSNATEIGVITTASASVSATPFPGVEARASVSATASLVNTTTFSGDNTTSTELTYEGKVSAIIPAYKSYEVFLTAKMVTMQYDVVCTYVQIDSVNGKQVKRPGALYTNTATVTIKNAAELNATIQVVGDAGTGTGTGTPAPADNSNRQLNMDGSSNYITLGNIGNVNDWTIELWFKPGPLRNYENLFHSKDLGNNAGVRLEMSAASSDGKLYVSVAGTDSYLPTTIVAYTENLSADWHHLAIVGNKSQNKLLVYLDGVKKVDKAHTSWPASFPNFVLGRGLSADQGRNYNGSMDEVRIWSIARNAADIQATKNSVTGNEANLLANYNFNQGIPGGDNRSTPTLMAKKGANGTMIGFTLNGNSSNFIK